MQYVSFILLEFSAIIKYLVIVYLPDEDRCNFRDVLVEVPARRFFRTMIHYPCRNEGRKRSSVSQSCRQKRWAFRLGDIFWWLNRATPSGKNTSLCCESTQKRCSIICTYGHSTGEAFRWTTFSPAHS